MGQEFNVNLKENNQAWLSLWALIPDKVIKDKIYKPVEYWVESFDLNRSKNAEESQQKKKVERDLTKLILNEEKYIVSRAKTIIKEIENLSQELNGNQKITIINDKPIILMSDKTGIMNFALLRIDIYTYQLRIFVNSQNYEWNSDISFIQLSDYEINVGDENEDLDDNQELFIKVKAENFIGTVSFYSYGVGEGEFQISWLKDEYLVLSQLTQVLEKLAKLIYRS